MIYKIYALYIKLFCLLFLSGHLFISCNDIYSEDKMEGVILMSDVKVDVEPDLTLPVGIERKVNYEIVPDNVTDPELRWEVADINVAEILQDGVITTKNIGKTLINISQNVAFNVLRSINLNVVGPAESITLDNMEFYEGASIDILDYVTVVPSDSYKVFDYEISDETVISCNNGILTGLKAGTSDIMIKAKDGSGLEARANVKVLESVPVEQITFHEGQEFALNEKAKLKFSVYPVNGVIEVLNWESSDDEILTVTNKGFIEAKNFGTVTITVSNNNGIIAQVNATVAPGKINDYGEYLNVYKLKIDGGGVGVIESNKLVVTYAKGKKRQDLQRGTTYIDVSNYPILAIKRESDNIAKMWTNLDFRIKQGNVWCGVNEEQLKVSNKIDINNNTNVLWVDMSSQSGFEALKSKEMTEMSQFNFKIGHNETVTGYTIHWVKTFKSIDELNSFLEKEDIK